MNIKLAPNLVKQIFSLVTGPKVKENRHQSRRRTGTTWPSIANDSLIFSVTFLMFTGAQTTGYGDVVSDYVPDSSYTLVGVISLFEPALPHLWGLPSQRMISYEKKGQFIAPCVRPAHDKSRGEVAEVCFPIDSSEGSLTLNTFCGHDPRMRGFCFWARHIAGDKNVKLSVYSRSRKMHYFKTIKLSKKWQRYRIALKDFRSGRHSGSVAQAENINLLKLHGGEGECRFLLDDLVIEGNHNLVGEPFFVIRPHDRQWCFWTNEKPRLSYLLSSVGGRKAELRVSGQVHTGHRFEVKKNLHVSAGVSRGLVTLDTLPPGYYDVSVNLFVRDSSDTSVGHRHDGIEDHFIVCPPTGYSTTPIGINALATAFGPGQFKSLGKAGIKTVRIWGIDWRHLELLPDQIDWTATDAIVSWANAAGLKLLAITGYAPSWKIAPPRKKQPPWSPINLLCSPYSDLEQGAEIAQKLASRYKDDIAAWEVWNEPDYNRADGKNYFFGESAEFFPILKNTYKGIKKGNASAPVVLGGLSMGPESDLAFTGKLLKAGYHTYFDIFGVHAYRNWKQTAKHVESIRKVRSEIPVWMTEVQARFPGGDTDAALSKFLQRLPRRITTYLAGGVEHFSIMQMSRYLIEPFASGSLLNANGSPMRRLAAVCTIARVLGDCDKGELVKLKGRKVGVYRFSTSDNHGVILFGSGSVLITSEAHKLKKVDALGGESSIDVGKKGIRVTAKNGEITYLHSPSPIEIN
ncbi:MAG: cellulase family glycosylhydrolase [Chitinivibrionales bacterium]|nr:cellulase family glycosylhydrolase [Chitinivibrionales bacterium]MBD3357613.1 cellulase family glycosylhydrolase [Chitinivibrionales bacterium]